MGGGDSDSGSQVVSKCQRGSSHHVGVCDGIVHRFCDFDDTDATLPKLNWSGSCNAEEGEEGKKEGELHNERLMVR